MMTDMLPNNTTRKRNTILQDHKIYYNFTRDSKYPICIKIILNHGIINATHRKSSDTV